MNQNRHSTNRTDTNRGNIETNHCNSWSKLYVHVAEAKHMKDNYPVANDLRGQLSSLVFLPHDTKTTHTRPKAQRLVTAILQDCEAEPS